MTRTIAIPNLLAGRGRGLAFGLPAVTLALAVLWHSPAAATLDGRLALSEIAEDEAMPAEPAEEPAPAAPAQDAAPGPVKQVPLPDPIQRFPLPVPEPGVGTGDDDPATGDDPDAAGEGEPEPVPDIVYDVSLLPEPVQRMRQRIMEICVAGDVEGLRPLLGLAPAQTQLSFGGLNGDPIDFLRDISGDDEGQEILAILYEVLDAGYVHLDAGTPEELYVWPYFFAVPLEGLTAPQRVELFKIVTAGDYEEMKNYGAYNFYRVGISPEGEWAFFVAGD